MNAGKESAESAAVNTPAPASNAIKAANVGSEATGVNPLTPATAPPLKPLSAREPEEPGYGYGV